jgi:polyhydroxybutyrate depolymerase
VAAMATCLGALAGCPAPGGRVEYRTLTHDDRERSYAIYVPDSVGADMAVPLVVCLHGARGDAATMIYLTGFNAIADREGFIVVYPEGIGNQWNDGRGVSFGRDDLTDVDDVGFIGALLDEVTAEHAIDPGRVYVSGASNGGMMCHRLACELSNRFAAAAPVMANMPEPLAEACEPVAPISLLAINGTGDSFVPYDGGAVAGRPNYGYVLSVDATAAEWVERNGIGLEPDVVALPDTDPNDGTTATRAAYRGEDGTDVIVYTVNGGGHTWPGGPNFQRQWLLGTVSRDFSASETIWDFFEAHPK